LTDLTRASWRKSSRSGGNNGQCVELGHGGAVIGVRDSKNPDGALLTFDQTRVAEFLAAAKAGRFDG
jgi:hypothetical protein